MIFFFFFMNECPNFLTMKSILSSFLLFKKPKKIYAFLYLDFTGEIYLDFVGNICFKYFKVNELFMVKKN